MGTAAVSGNVYAKYPVKYIDGQWKKYVDGSYQSISDSDVMAAWTSKISALKDAASGFVTGISRYITGQSGRNRHLLWHWQWVEQQYRGQIKPRSFESK